MRMTRSIGVLDSVWPAALVSLVGACSRSTAAPAAPAETAPPAETAVPAVATPVADLPKGPRVYVSNEGSGNVTVIDIASSKAVATFPVGKRPRGIQRSPDGSRVYVALSGTAASPPGSDAAPPPPDPSAHAGSASSTPRPFRWLNDSRRARTRSSLQLAKTARSSSSPMKTRQRPRCSISRAGGLNRRYTSAKNRRGSPRARTDGGYTITCEGTGVVEVIDTADRRRS